MRVTVTIEPPFRTNPSMLASATVTLETEAGIVRINDCRLLQNKAGIVWFSLPTYHVKDASPKRSEFLPTIELSPVATHEVTTEALRAYQLWAMERAEGCGQ
jgi:hypothetical protein